MHGGFMHIAFNMLTLASFGPVLESFWEIKSFDFVFSFWFGAFVLFNLGIISIISNCNL
jgi:membrane associated rhomboid family serine protease